MEPAAKKAKTEEAAEGGAAAAAAEAEAGATAEAAAPAEPEVPAEAEEDEKPVAAAKKLKEKVTFYTEETTLNVMPSTFGSLLVPLTDGGLQYLMASARACAGIKAGRYMFEAKVVEVINPADDSAARQRTPMPRNQLRIGVSTASSSLFLGETEQSVCFDQEGDLVHHKKRTNKVSQKFGAGDVLALVVNLDSTSSNSDTISLFKNGVRASQPQALPESLKGKALFPTLTFKNVTVHYNFGPEPLMQLPFACNMVAAADKGHLTLTPKPDTLSKEGGKPEVLFPVCLPDEGTFDWLDLFLEKNPHYTELSDRSILQWCEASGLWRTKGYGPGARSSNDKP